MPAELIEASDALRKNLAGAMNRLQIRVAGDAVPVAGFGQHLGPFVLLMAGCARDVAMGRSLIRLMLTHAMACLAFLVVDRVGAVGEGEQPLQRSPRRVTAPTFVLEQTMRRSDVAGIRGRAVDDGEAPWASSDR